MEIFLCEICNRLPNINATHVYRPPEQPADEATKPHFNIYCECYHHLCNGIPMIAFDRYYLPADLQKGIEDWNNFQSPTKELHLCEYALENCSRIIEALNDGAPASHILARVDSIQDYLCSRVKEMKRGMRNKNE